MIKVIQNDEMYESYLQRIEELADSQKGTEEADELEVIIALVRIYEQENIHLPALDPIDAIKNRMDDLNLKNKDLESIMGDAGNISKILSRKRSLTVEMIRGLSKKLSLPIEVLVGPGKEQTA
jgi:HTH-type transcriptional regulator/antitoxin HigA